MPGAGTPSSPGTLLTLELADLLCIRDGRGMRIRVVSGVLWVTEEYGCGDHVLAAGDALDIANNGMAIVSADQPARIVIEFLPGSTSPRKVELACADGRRRLIALAAPAWITLSAIAAALADATGRLFASVRTLAKALVAYREHYLPRRMRPRTLHGPRRVERAVIDQWLMWRR